VTAHLENTQIHLYKVKPNDEDLLRDEHIPTDSSNSSFFVGLSRLTYIREARQSKVVEYILIFFLFTYQ